MLQVRMSTRRGPWLERLGPAIADALHAHPLAPHLDAIALLGVGDPFLVRPGDPALKVVVPLLGGERPDAIARRQLESASAVVLLDGAEATDELAETMTVAVEGSAAGLGFLRTASAFDEMQAEVALGGLADLRRCIHGARASAIETPITPGQLADAVIEAVIAAGGAP